MFPHRLAPALLLACLFGPGATTSPGRTAPLREVVLVFKTHFDIGYTDMASNVVQRYRTGMIDDALRVVDQNLLLPHEQQFAWTIPGWPATQILADGPGQSPERRERILRAFRSGHFVVHALPFTTHTELLEPEDLVRGLRFSTDLARRLGQPFPRDAKMTDVPSHSWILPTLLHHAGVDFLHLGCNPASSSPRVPPLFWWEGADGSRLLTMYSPAGYGTGLVPPADWPYPVWLALIQTGDNHGPPRPEEIGTLLADARTRLPGVRVRIGRLSDFSDALRTAVSPEAIPVVRGDMPDTWIHGPMCDPAGASLARRVRPATEIHAALDAQLRAWGAPRNPLLSRLDQVRELSLLYGEHTWGGAFSWVTPYGRDLRWAYGDAWERDRAAGRFRRLEASWDEHSSYIHHAARRADPIEAVQDLARLVASPSARIVVYNPCPWPADGVVEVACPDASSITSIRAVPDGTPLAVSGDAEGIRFIARQVPACGYRTYEPVRGTPLQSAPDLRAGGTMLENRFLRVTLDPMRGCIGSLIEKSTGREWVKPGAPHGFAQFLHERFSSNNAAAYVRDYVKIDADWALAELGKPALPPDDLAPYQALTPTNTVLTLSTSGISATATLTASTGLPAGLVTRVTLHADLPWLDVEVVVRGKPADPWPEAGWVSFPIAIDQPQARIGRPGSIIDPRTDIVPGSNRDLMAVHTGVALHGPDGAGIGICPVDSPLVSIGQPGCWRYTREITPPRAGVYFNLYNNQWTTNFRLWNSGTWTYRFRIWCIGKWEPGRDLIRPAIEARQPLLAAYSDSEHGHLPATRQGLRIHRDGVLMTTFEADPRDRSTLLRLWESAGLPGLCEVTLPEGFPADEAQPEDLRGRPTGTPIRVRDGRVTVDLRRFAPSSLRLR